MKNFEPLILNSNEAREPFSGGASEAGITTSRSNIKNIGLNKMAHSNGTTIVISSETGVNNTRSNIKNRFS